MTAAKSDNSPFFISNENPDTCPYYLISRTSLHVTAALRKGFADAGVTTVKPSYLGVLMALWRSDGPKSVDLGRQAGLEPSTMTGLLDRMERDGLVRREPDKQDRRVQRIHLTKIGRQVRKPVLRSITAVLKRVFAGIDPSEMSQTMDLLKKVLQNAGEGRKP